jgi:hypothetical protein
MADARSEVEWVLLGQAGYDAAAVWAQVERISNSNAFDGKDTQRKIFAHLVEEALKGHVPQHETVAQRFGSNGETFARTNTNRVREQLVEYYDEEAKRGEIRLNIMPKSYLVVAPLHIAASSGVDIPASASILEPADGSEVYARVPVSGRIDVLDPDLRVWLIVLATDGFYYLQGRVSRRSPAFQNHTRTGRMQWGEFEGVEFVILLVAADIDADYEFQGNMKRCDDGFGTRLPADTQVLHSVRVVRRDIRPGGPTTDRIPPKAQS